MWCAKCGSQMQPEERFCKNCGNPAKAPDAPTGSFYEAPPVPKRSALDMKKLLPVLLISLAVIVLGVLAWIFGPQLFGGGAAQTMSGSIMLFGSDGGTIVAVDNNPTYSLDTNVSNAQRSLDGRTAAVISNQAGDGSGELYVLTAKGKTLVSEGVVSFILAGSGGGIAYVKDYDSQTYSGTLYLYDCAAKKSEKVAGNVFVQQQTMIAGISPDGRTVGYITDLDQQAVTFAGHMKTIGNPVVDLGDNFMPIMLSDGGTILYYFTVTGEYGNPTIKFFVRNGKKDVELITDNNQTGSFTPVFNANHTQMLFCYDGKAYVTKNGGEKQMIYGKEISSVPLPPNTPANFSSGGVMNGIVAYGLADFSNFFLYSSDNELVFVNGNGQGSKVTSSPKYYAVAGGGKLAYAVDDSDTLYRYTMGAEIQKDEVASGVTCINLSQDGSRLYYVNADSELYFVRDAQKPVKVADSVSTNTMGLTANGSSLYFLMDYADNTGSLHCTKDGGKESWVADDVYQVVATATAVYYYDNYDSSNSTYDVYRAGPDGKFKLLQSGVTGTR